MRNSWPNLGNELLRNGYQLYDTANYHEESENPVNYVFKQLRIISDILRLHCETKVSIILHILKNMVIIIALTNA